MADITLFKADLSDSTFVAPFGRHVVADRVDVEGEEDESGGGRGKLLVVGALGVAVVVGGLALAVTRRFRGGSDDPEESEWGDEDWDDEGELAFDEPLDAQASGPTAASKTTDTDGSDDAFEAGEESSRSGAVAAVVGLLFLLLVTALVRRRQSTPEVDEEYGDDSELVTATR